MNDNMTKETASTAIENSEPGQICSVDQQELSPAQIKRNVILFVLLGSAFTIGTADLQLAMQPLLVDLNASNTMIGFINGAPIMALAGIFFSPWITRYFPKKKKYFFFVNVPYVGMFLLIGLIVIFADKLHLTQPHLLTYVFILSVANCFLGGFCSVPAQEYTAACIPMSHRGRQIGYAFSIGGIVSFCVAVFSGWLLSYVSKPAAFGCVILIGWFIMQSGFVMTLFAKEVPSPVQNSPSPWSGAMFKAVWHDKIYLRFILVYFLYSAVFAQMHVFVNVYGFKHLQMPAATAAVMAIVNQISRVAVSIPFGHLIDRLSPKRILPYSFILFALAMFILVVFQNQYGLYASISISAIGNALLFPAQNALLLGIPSASNRAGHYSVQLIVFYIAVGLGTMSLGWLFDVLLYQKVFIVLGLIAVFFIPFCRHMFKNLPDKMNSYS